MPADPNYIPPDNGPSLEKATSVDLQKITVGAQTFSNPFFWMFVGTALGVGLCWFLNKEKKNY